MNTTTYFSEKQKVRQTWIFILVSIILLVWLWELVQQVILGIPLGQNPSPDWVILLIGLVPIFFVLLLIFLRLETIVDEEGIHYRMWPLQGKFRTINKNEIAGWEVRKYRPMRDYGGWGIRIGFQKNAVAFNMSGNLGAMFKLKSGKQILIGTRRHKEMQMALEKLLTAESKS